MALYTNQSANMATYIDSMKKLILGINRDFTSKKQQQYVSQEVIEVKLHNVAVNAVTAITLEFCLSYIGTVLSVISYIPIFAAQEKISSGL